MGAKGIYYRKTLSSPKGKSTSSKPRTKIEEFPGRPTTPSVQMENIDSADILELTDGSSQELLNEIEENRKKPRYFFIGLAGAAIEYVCFLVFFGWISDLTNNSDLVLNIGSAVAVFVLPAILLTILWYVRQYDIARTTTVVFYDLEGEPLQKYKDLSESFATMQSVQKVWHIPSSGKIETTQERKKASGANALVNRERINLLTKSPKMLSTNVDVPTIPVGEQELFFFPDFVLVNQDGKLASISYENFSTEISAVGFVETEGVPSDSEVVGQTWQYTNIKGGPDKRYADNPELPIVKYETLKILSKTGLNELLHLSKIGGADAFSSALKNIAG